jgi:hypothetical protein
MFAVRGIYDGKKVKITDRISEKKRYRVVVTFIEELPLEENEIRDFASQTESFDFWDNKVEDIYQDYLTKKRNK